MAAKGSASIVGKNQIPFILGISRQKAQEWCIKHGFELVELNPEELPDEDGEFPSTSSFHEVNFAACLPARFLPRFLQILISGHTSSLASLPALVPSVVGDRHSTRIKNQHCTLCHGCKLPYALGT